MFGGRNLNFKKLIAIVVCLAILLSSVIVTNIFVYAEITATVYSEEISATAGQTVKVPVMIKDNTGIMGWKLTFDYDTDVLTPLSVEYGEVISGGLQDNIEGDMVPGSINVYWAGSDNEYYNGKYYIRNMA